MPKFFPFLPEGKSQCFIEKKKKRTKNSEKQKRKNFYTMFFSRL